MADARSIKHPKDKKYVVVKAVDKPDKYKGSWKVGDVIRIVPSDYLPYIEGRFLIPYASQADSQVAKITPPLPPKTVQKELPPPKTTPPSETNPPDSSKKVITNSLSDAVQKKKAEIAAATKANESVTTETEDKTASEETKKASLTAEKLAAIKAGGQK